MEVLITGHHVTITDSVREFVNKQLKKLENHYHQPTKVDVILQKSNGIFHSEASFHARKLHVHAKSASGNMYTAIRSMASKLDRQVVKHKELITDHGRHSDGQKTIRH